MNNTSTLLAAAALAVTGCAALPPAALTLHAAGVQVYECRSADASARPDWAFVAPEADLYDAGGQRVGRHFAGPTWEAADGSRVTATVTARLPARSPDSIPELKLAARSDSAKGAFAGVTAIERVDTVGGAAPHEGCTAATTGTRVRVPYAARYVFFKA